ncbi:MAG TPA: NADH:flavin oxidoreductase/NADH oxidase [Acidimicrobiales bacterium]|nr:NADH:flavin oxidoreductase/NADH oxidase [Acidimicrobiales bacterium]
MSTLFSPMHLRDLTLANRVWVSPMCQYSSVDGRPTDWHLVHLGSLARGGAGLVMTEATAVSPEGRISPSDAGIWTDEQAADYRRITDFIHTAGSAAGIQLGHAGRKASTDVPWEGRSWVPLDRGGWEAVGPSPIGYGNWPAPRALDDEGIATVVADFAAAARRAEAAGFDVVELHAAHGYLLHQFLSPLTNTRSDAYGGDLEGRSRLLLEVVEAVRRAWPAGKPVLVRLSATDWAPGGWDVEDTVKVAVALRQLGVDLIDVSSGGNVPEQQIAIGPGYQVAFARAVREGAGIATAAVGLLSEPVQAEQVLVEGAADAVFLARALLRDPHWPQRAAAELGDPVPVPKQYERAWGR